MLEPRPAHRPRRSVQPPFAHILCALDGGAGDEHAIEQAIAVADGDAGITFLASWYGSASQDRAVASEHEARTAVADALARGRERGVRADHRLAHAPRLSDAVLRAEGQFDLVVVPASPHARMTGIVLGETATRLIHTSATPVLIARDAPLDAGVVAGTRAVPGDRVATTAAAHVAARLGADLCVVHVPCREGHDAELDAELANARALLGRELDYVTEYGYPARALVAAAEDEGAGLVVVGSTGRKGLPALVSVSERVAHLAPCSVLVMRCD